MNKVVKPGPFADLVGDIAENGLNESADKIFDHFWEMHELLLEACARIEGTDYRSQGRLDLPTNEQFIEKVRKNISHMWEDETGL